MMAHCGFDLHMRGQSPMEKRPFSQWPLRTKEKQQDIGAALRDPGSVRQLPPREA